MPLRINNNIAALNARRNMNANFWDQGLRLERLSSGLRVNRAADDAAGLSVREGMRSRVERTAAERAECGAGQQPAPGRRRFTQRDQRHSSTVNDLNRESIQSEFSQIIQEIDRISPSTTYNDTTLLTGFGNSIDTASTVITASNTSGVSNVKISGASSGTYTFVDGGNDAEITLTVSSPRRSTSVRFWIHPSTSPRERQRSPTSTASEAW